MLELTLTHGPVPVLLFPNIEGDDPLSARRTTHFPGTVTVRSPGERRRAGGLVAVWQVALQRYKAWPPAPGEAESEKRKDGDWEILERIVKPLRDGDFVLNEGEEQTYTFEFALDSSLPRCRMTPWERVAHTLTIFALAPSPLYSVIPPMRDPLPASPPYSPSLSPSLNDERPGSPSSFGFDPARRRSSLLDGLRRLSTASSRASTASHDSGRSKRKGKEKEEEGFDADPPPLPLLETPFIAEAHKEIIVTATADAPGHVRGLAVEKVLDVKDLGRIHLYANSDMFIIGSAFMNCFLITDLNPLATLHAYQITLTQRLISPDRSTVHVDRYTLHRQGRSYTLTESDRPAERDILWRGHLARTLEAAQRKADKRKKASDDWPAPGHASRVHLTCGPRLPSSAIGGRPTWDRPEPGFSTIEHSLEFTWYWSVFGRDGEGRPLPPAKVNNEGVMRATTMKVRPDVGSCSFSFANVITPGYSAVAEFPAAAAGKGPHGSTSTPGRFTAAVDVAVSVDQQMEGCMDPFKRGTEPRPFTMIPDSWVEQGGRRHRLGVGATWTYDAKSFDLRQHQLDTDTQCACFYEDAHEAYERGHTWRPRVVHDFRPVGETEAVATLDWAVLKPVRGGRKAILAEKDRRSEAWWARHGKERRAIPGFVNYLFEECPCEAAQRAPEDEARRVSFASLGEKVL